MLAIYKKELKSYFINMTGYIFIAFLLLVTGVLCFAMNLVGGYPSLEVSFSTISIVFLLIVPILTMKVWSDEKHQKTANLLYSLPMSITNVVVGKFLAMVTVFLIPMAVISVYPVFLNFYGTVYFSATYSAVIGLFLFGCALISVGMFVSSVTESQVISAVVSFAVLLAIYIIPSLVTLIPSSSYATLISFTVLILLFAGIVYLLTKSSFASLVLAIVFELILYVVYFINSSLFEGAFARLISALSLYDRFSAFVNGIFDLTAVIYYLSVIFLMNFLTVQSVEKRRWS